MSNERKVDFHGIGCMISAGLTVSLPIAVISILAFGKYAYIGLILAGFIMGFALLWATTEVIFRKLGMIQC